MLSILREDKITKMKNKSGEVIQKHKNEKYKIAIKSEKTPHMFNRSFRKRELRNNIWRDNGSLRILQNY